MKRVLLTMILVVGFPAMAVGDSPTVKPLVPDHVSFNHDPVAPDGYELVFRSVIVRLGPDWNWYENKAHGSAGVQNVSIDGNRNLVVTTDFDQSSGEIILYAGANPDAQLVLKGVTAGGSGGSNVTRYTITSSRDLPGYRAYTRIRPNAKVFNSELDNLWIQQVSMRPVG